MTLSLRRGIGSEEESKDPDTAYRAMPHQGVLMKIKFFTVPLCSFTAENAGITQSISFSHFPFWNSSEFF
jgi:hypothetical protein